MVNIVICRDFNNFPNSWNSRLPNSSTMARWQGGGEGDGRNKGKRKLERLHRFRVLFQLRQRSKHPSSYLQRDGHIDSSRNEGNTDEMAGIKDDCTIYFLHSIFNFHSSEGPLDHTIWRRHSNGSTLGDVPKKGKAVTWPDENSPAKHEIFVDNRCSSRTCAQLGHGRSQVIISAKIINLLIKSG